MAQTADGSDQPRKLLAGGAVKAKIALASALVLALGAWLAPRAEQTVLSVPQERAAPLLEEQVQLREVSRPFVGVQDVAAPLVQHGVAILRPASPDRPGRNDYSATAVPPRGVAGFGVFVSGTHVLTHSAALDGRSTAEISLAGGALTLGELVTDELPTGLVLLQVPPSEGRVLATVAADAPAPGALAVAAGRFGDRDTAVPVFVTSVGREEYTIGAVNDGILPGMPVFNLAGELLALAAPDGQELRAIPIRPAAARLLARAASGERESSFGLGFQEPTGRLSETFGSDGVLVTDVLPGGPAAAAGVRVGDVLLAVGEAQIDTADTAARLLRTAPVGTPATLRVRRGTRVSGIDATPATAYEIAARARARVDRSGGPEARALFSDEVLEASAIPPSARVISVNGRAVTTRAQVQRELRSARQAVPVLVREGTTQFFVAVEPAR